MEQPAQSLQQHCFRAGAELTAAFPFLQAWPWQSLPPSQRQEATLPRNGVFPPADSCFSQPGIAQVGCDLGKHP